jgi:hypothetical protein
MLRLIDTLSKVNQYRHGHQMEQITADPPITHGHVGSRYRARRASHRRLLQHGTPCSPQRRQLVPWLVRSARTVLIGSTATAACQSHLMCCRATSSLATPFSSVSQVRLRPPGGALNSLLQQREGRHHRCLVHLSELCSLFPSTLNHLWQMCRLLAHRPSIVAASDSDLLGDWDRAI